MEKIETYDEYHDNQLFVCVYNNFASKNKTKYNKFY